MKLSNDVEKYEIEVTKMGQNYSFFPHSEECTKDLQYTKEVIGGTLLGTNIN